MKKLYIVGPNSGGEGVYSLVADDGECLASHLCSRLRYAKSDLHDNRSERKEEWKKKYGQYEILLMGDDEMTDETLLKRNKEWFEKNH